MKISLGRRLWNQWTQQSNTKQKRVAKIVRFLVVFDCKTLGKTTILSHVIGAHRKLIRKLVTNIYCQQGKVL